MMKIPNKKYKTIEQFERTNYNLFKFWFEQKPLENPRTAITASLARNIAILVYDETRK